MMRRPYAMLLMICSVALLSSACGSTTSTPAPTTPTPTPTPPPPPAVNTPPVIDAIRVTLPAEFRSQVSIVATVRDAETPVNQLQYEWTATRGTFTGTGSSVTYQLDQPALSTSPVSVDVTLKVTETVSNASPNVVSRTQTFQVHDSWVEARALASQFLGDFTNPTASPEFVVRNFSDNCPKKAEELANVRVNRQLYVIDPQRSMWSIQSVIFQGDPPMSRHYGNVKAVCNFVSLVKATGRTEFANGTCSLDVFFDIDHWALCDSSFAGTSLTTQSLRGLVPGTR